MANKGPSMDLSSFQDIMTCILGILILIILLTGIDASQIVVLVATPRQAANDDRKPVLFECRDNQIFYIDRAAIEKACEERGAKIFERVGGDENEFLKEAASAFVQVGAYRIDYGLSMTGTFLLSPVESVKGFQFQNFKEEQTTGWFSDQLAHFDPEHDFICFFVRPNSFEAFQRARAVSWLKGFSIACELMQPREPVKLGVGGNRVLAQ
ncbi:MAG: hypothetical protein ILO10_03330 [Kiritimatiellae bacterium]|nr:hypothetical protein [Kiritimatiellia bacterium]